MLQPKSATDSNYKLGQNMKNKDVSSLKCRAIEEGGQNQISKDKFPILFPFFNCRLWSGDKAT